MQAAFWKAVQIVEAAAEKGTAPGAELPALLHWVFDADMRALILCVCVCVK